MADIVEEYKARMKNAAPDIGRPGNEWEIVNELLANPPNELDPILEWIFVEHKGYVDPRAIAGLKFLERNSERGWQLLERLIQSDDPDDRGTALEVLKRAGNSEKYYLAEPALTDRYAYLQLETAELVKDIFPNKVKAVLDDLANHSTEKETRLYAQELLSSWYKDQ